ncbi:MAG: DASS family sodium-coupled anion symporter [Pseudomonadota bacterium]
MSSQTRLQQTGSASTDLKESFLNNWQGAKLIPFMAVISFAAALWWLPVPAGLSPKAWHLFIIFLSTIIAIIAKILPMGALTLLAISVCLGTHTLTLEQSLISFKSNVLWLIIFAFLIARGFIKTGLGTRVAYQFIAIIGKSTLGLSYGLILTDLILAPFIPSNTARGGGIIFPIVNSLTGGYDSRPHQPSRKKIGAFLIKLAFQANLITSAMFLTSMASNPLIASLAEKVGITITWGTWALATIVPGLLNLILLPLIMFRLFPPEVKKTPQAPAMAREKLKDIGPMRMDEMIMLGTFSLLLFLWVFGSQFGIQATTAALFGLVILLFSGVLTWKDVLNENVAWDTFVWLGTLLMMASHLSEFGMMTWLSGHMQQLVVGINVFYAVTILALSYFYIHYLFPSMTAHITSLYSGVVVLSVSLGAPPLFVALMFAILSNLCGGITHYGTGSAPVFFGSGYVNMKEWWRVGGLLSLFNLAIWAVVGGLWWKIIGLW